MRGGYTTSDELFTDMLNYANLERGQSVGPLKLDRMAELCRILGNPESGFKSIHVAGSKGKGSVSVMLANILEAGGIECGLYLSPHVLDYRERISRPGGYLAERVYLDSGEELAAALRPWARRDYSNMGAPSFFELCTALAFLCFRRANLPWAVIETGLGGRLDSTNVLFPQASVISSIELEHTEFLGDTIAKIAFEKAGIIKKSCPCYVARLPTEAITVVRDKAYLCSSPLFELPLLANWDSKAPRLTGMDFSLRFTGLESGYRIECQLALLGKAQADNAALACLVAHSLFPHFKPSIIAKGLSAAKLPARFQILRTSPLMVVDGAHTPASVAQCLENWLAVCVDGAGTLVFSCAADKQVGAMAGILAPHFQAVIVCDLGPDKPSRPDDIAAAFSRSLAKNLYVEESRDAALRLALSKGSPVLVCGSFYLAGAAIDISRAV